MKHVVSTAGAWCVIGITAYTLFMGLFPFRTIDVKQPAQVLNSVVDAGDVLKYEVDYCKYTSAPARITKTIVSSDEEDAQINYTIISFNSDLPEGCGKFISTLHVPDYIQDGDYYLNVNVQYRINFLQTKTYEYRTEPFYVFNPLPESPEDKFAEERLALFR